MTNKVLILDSSAILGGFKPHLINQKQYITSGVFNEIKSSEAEKNLNLGFEQGKILVKDPSKEALDYINSLSQKSGDSFVLSEVDKSILALGLDLKKEGKLPVILTDDYSMQNIATMLELEFDSIIESGIKKQINWKIICPACKLEYPHSKKHSICEVCGTQLKRVINK
ncbi:MAG: hypothetical protein EAX96_17315 [Candidatus Lokiarchaeota archaeon]|nr:hypothetical protein [Candidatus Lokiarchaeota archaeon]